MLILDRSSHGLDVLRTSAVLGRETWEERIEMLATFVSRWGREVEMEGGGRGGGDFGGECEVC
jgi:hypothetical protein